MFKKLGRRMNDHCKKFMKELEDIKKNQTRLWNTITEMKSTLEGSNVRLETQRNTSVHGKTEQ